MKKIYISFAIALLLSVCAQDGADNPPIITDEISTDEMSTDEALAETADPFRNFPNLSENLKAHLSLLRSSWDAFESGKRQDVDPTEDFYNSEYMKQFKELLSLPESLALSESDLNVILSQNTIDFIDKNFILSNGKEYNIRIITYNANYYVQAITDIIDIPSKWIFVQCRNEEDWYFTTLSDGDIYAAYDCLPIEADGILHILLTGSSYSHSPLPPFLWDFDLTSEGFKPGGLFRFDKKETDEYFIYNNIDWENNLCLFKWTFQTDGSFLSAEFRVETEKDAPSDYLNVSCEFIKDEKTALFKAVNNSGEEISSMVLKCFPYPVFQQKH